MIKALLSELLIILTVVIFTTLIYLSMTGFHNFFMETIDIKLQHSYFVVGEELLVMHLSLITYFITMTIRQFWLKFRRIIANIMLVLCSMVMIYFYYNDFIYTCFFFNTYYGGNSVFLTFIYVLWPIIISFGFMIATTIFMSYRNRKLLKP